ncbi:RNA-binding S4 domain-containing protein [Bacteroides eggerthii]|jgi:23S rRNA pseudouridine2605 synthase|uniref:pseudouridine synthase n=1 Tax=Bacteroides eggerthii TaxID=28111 RepID=UPI001C376E16|nr:pseudouridine synthase [Bacteroides eggerthii]MBV3847803.1 RNA-binding S4 domain-containing protein [Bacteroides eggerthii]MBV3885984.1 RNA-binding S4 domain-containing protein [Bacteroides eggerthii]MBV3892937.1 RNA-binding S4 domain-containing protein [Bacteroides eggerthii]MBV3904094.1 RNA-binding S4 domain-containing protein [Bacteroides eggerthii]MBV3921582.1 RNA-binding S4 domain-containing protein [Bacteroides eggerthii]
MSTENETWRDASSSEENSGAGRDGNQFNREGGYNRPSYNRENGDRPYRPRFNNENGDRPQRAYSSDRSYRPRFNPNGENGDRPQRSYGNNAGGDRPYRPRYNSEGGDRPQRSYGNNAGGDRPYRPRYNSEGGDRPQRSYGNNAGGDRSYRPRYNSEGGDRPQRSYGNNAGGDRPYRPRYNSEGGDRPQRSYGNNAGGDRPYRPRYNGEGGDRPQRPYGNRDSYSRPIRRTADYDPNAKYSKKKQIEYKEQFVDPNEPIRLNKFLANAGVCSRREADEFITAGVVSVNGEVVTELGTKIKRGDEVKFHDQAVSIERKIYVLLNKPKDTVTTSDDPQARRTVMDLVKGACSERIYPVGRLDRNTTGVLLLTNDGDLASKLTHPKYLKKKIYHVHLDKNLTKADMEQIAAGIQLDDGEIQADAISYTDDFKKDEVGIEIHSGKNRIVRRIFESLGYKVVKLDRVFFAGLTKKGLRRGEWRYLTEQEVNFLRMGSFE